MELRPRYGTDAIIVLDGAPADIVEPTVRQRRRLAAALADFSDEQWAHASRCDGWSSRDVIVHLESTNRFWAYSIAAGLRGEPTQLLATFDPVASPAQLVADSAELTADDVLDRFVASTEALAELLASIGDDDWAGLAEAPPGHLGISVVAHHALWDSWVHERDILLPMGMAPDVEADEVAASLRYAAALNPAFAVVRGDVDGGSLALAVTDPEVSAVVEISDRVAVRTGTADADLLLTGNAVELLEALSVRAPFSQSIPPEHSWMLNGLPEVFDTERV